MGPIIRKMLCIRWMMQTQMSFNGDALYVLYMSEIGGVLRKQLVWMSEHKHTHTQCRQQTSDHNIVWFFLPHRIYWFGRLCDHLANVSYTCAYAFFLAGILAIYTKYILHAVYALSLCTYKIKPGIANSPFADSSDKYSTPTNRLVVVHF